MINKQITKIKQSAPEVWKITHFIILISMDFRRLYLNIYSYFAVFQEKRFKGSLLRIIFGVFVIQMIQDQRSSEERLIQCVLVVDIDPSLDLFKPNQQKWVSSLELFAQIPKQTKNIYKIINLTHGLYLQVGYCEKNRPPIYQIDFVNHPTMEWISVKTPIGGIQKCGGVTLCYKAGENPACEPLTDIEILITQRKRMGQQKQVFTLPAGYKIVNNNPIAHNYLIYKRMRSPLQQTFKGSLHQKYPEQNVRINLAMIPLFCFPEGINLAKQLKGYINFNFILTTETGERFYANCLTFKESMEDYMKEKLGLPLGERIYYQKAMCLISRHRYTDQFSECLKHLYRLSMSKNDVPFHKVVSSFVENLVLPKELGINGMSYSYGGSNINFDTNPSYPIISERSIYCVFKFLPLQSIISIFEGILLEKKIIFVSQSKTVLGYAVEAFLSFIFPFRWQHVIIPILPSTLKDYLSAPVPIIVGITPGLLDRNVESDSIIVQLDNGAVLNDEDLPPLPDKMEKQLRKRLEMFQLYDEDQVREYLENPQSTYIFKMQEIEHPQFQGHLVRDCFYEFTLTLMKNYKKFWKIQKYKDNKENSSIGLTEPQLLNDMYRLQDFLSDLGMTKVGSFGYKLTQGTLFTSFIQRRHQYSDDPQLSFFDESLDKKKAKKDAKILQKTSNIRYNVAKHPQPEVVKKVYTYDRFPSILSKAALKQAQINVPIDSISQEEVQILEQFLQNEFKLNKKLFNEPESEDLDYKIESLLLEKYRIKYNEYCQMSNLKTETLRTSLISKHNRNLREVYDKLLIFQKLYVEQMSFMQEFFDNWPYQIGCSSKIIEVEKKDYLKKYLKGEFANQNQLLCVFEENYGKKCRNFQILQLGNTKIILLESQDLKTSQVLGENVRNSRKKLKYQYQVCVEHSKVKSFLNKVISSQGLSLFSFIVNRIKEENQFNWTMETLIQWRQHIQQEIKN